jgi:flagellar M-ring protein FliF
VGYDEARGDKVEVVATKFARPMSAGTEATKPGLLDMKSLDLMRGAEIGAALIAALALIIFVMGPMAAGLAKGPGSVTLIEGGGAGGATMIAGGGATQGGQQQVLLVPGAGQPAVGSAPPMASALPGPAGAEPEPLIDVARIRGQVRASSTKKIGEVVEQHPEESANIIRGWLNNAI